MVDLSQIAPQSPIVGLVVGELIERLPRLSEHVFRRAELLAENIQPSQAQVDMRQAPRQLHGLRFTVGLDALVDLFGSLVMAQRLAGVGSEDSRDDRPQF